MKWAVFAVLVAAAALRIPHLSERPMHADEAVLADKFGTLLETGRWSYDSNDYHGPVLPYLTLLSAKIAGERRYADLTETTLRAVPVALGLLLVGMPFLFARGIGAPAALAAAALTAVSPAMVYYSRYYIPEMALVLFTAGLIAAVYRRAWWPAALFAALMLLTKETAVFAIFSLGLAGVAAQGRVFAAGYLGRALGSQGHIQPATYYLSLILRSQAVIPILAVAGAVIGWKRDAVRFLSVYTLAMVAAYSLIPYKTPWCLLSFLYGMILLAGVGLTELLRTRRIVAGALILAGGLQLAYKPGEVYAYSPTSPDVLKLPPGLTDVQVISRQNVWPLPWYLRRVPHVEWRTAITPDMKPAPVILVSPEMEPALIHQLYEVPPPGERPLYGNLLDGDLTIRPGVTLRAYAQMELIDAGRR